MSTINLPYTLAAGFLAGLLSAGAAGAADAARGEKLHEVCLQCHGTDIYLPERRKIKTLRSLRKEVERWNDYYNPKMKKTELDDLVEYLNSRFYKFPPSRNPFGLF
jgi:mono/diheme cytochrome c family protein